MRRPGERVDAETQTEKPGLRRGRAFQPLVSPSPPPGKDVQWVHQGTATWSTNGNATRPATGGWAGYAAQYGSDAAGTVTAGTAAPNVTVKFTAGNTFPAWTRTNTFPNF